jgi:hypothetical protein
MNTLRQAGNFVGILEHREQCAGIAADWLDYALDLRERALLGAVR